MDGRVRRVLKLLQHVRVGRLVHNLLRLCHRTLHALGRVCEHQLRAKGAHEDAALDGHGGWHCEHKLVALGCSNECKGYAGVACTCARGREHEHVCMYTWEMTEACAAAYVATATRHDCGADANALVCATLHAEHEELCPSNKTLTHSQCHCAFEHCAG